MKKKGFTLIEMMAVMMIIAIIAVLAVPPILTSIRNSKKEISDAMEQVIVSASDLYMSDNSNEYARYNGNRYCITLRDLVESDKLTSPIYDPTTSQEISPDKFVKVDIFDNEYSYEIVDDCEEVRRNTLAYVLKQQYQEGNTTGLLKDESGYYYKGTKEEVANNFAWFAGHLWRVISIDNDDNLTMITQQPLTSIQPASAVWTTKESYEDSYINHWLNEVFLASMEESDKIKLLNNTYNVGIASNISEITTIQKVGILDLSQYNKADEDNSYLNILNYFWIGNREDNSFIYTARDLMLDYISVMDTSGIRPVIKVSNLTFSEGTGILSNPYREKSKTTSTSNVKVGEYISVPTSGTDCGSDKHCLFRVVSKDNDSIKVILNGLLPNTSATTVPYTSGSAIDSIVTAFADTINDTYRYTGNKTFNIGTYPVADVGQDYKIVKNTMYNGDVGLPVIGEMFSGNDIEVTTYSKIFVNANIIENPTVSDWFWLMNAFSDSYPRTISSGGDSYGLGLTAVYGVRPVLFLKNNLNFTSGEGTAENPFTLE